MADSNDPVPKHYPLFQNCPPRVRRAVREHVRAFFNDCDIDLDSVVAQYIAAHERIRKNKRHPDAQLVSNTARVRHDLAGFVFARLYEMRVNEERDIKSSILLVQTEVASVVDWNLDITQQDDLVEHEESYAMKTLRIARSFTLWVRHHVSTVVGFCPGLRVFCQAILYLMLIITIIFAFLWSLIILWEFLMSWLSQKVQEMTIVRGLSTGVTAISQALATVGNAGLATATTTSHYVVLATAIGSQIVKDSWFAMKEYCLHMVFHGRHLVHVLRSGMNQSETSPPKPVPFAANINGTLEQVIALSELGIQLLPATSLLGFANIEMIGASAIVMASELQLKEELAGAFDELQLSLDQASRHLRAFNSENEALMVNAEVWLGMTLKQIENIQNEAPSYLLFAALDWMLSWFRSGKPIHERLTQEYIEFLQIVQGQVKALLKMATTGENLLNNIFVHHSKVKGIMVNNARLIELAQARLEFAIKRGWLGTGITIGQFGRPTEDQILEDVSLQAQIRNLAELESAHHIAADNLKAAKDILEKTFMSLSNLLSMVTNSRVRARKSDLPYEIEYLMNSLAGVKNATLIRVESGKQNDEYWEARRRKCQGLHGQEYDSCFFGMDRRIEEGF